MRVLALCIVLAGCAAPAHWVKDGASEREFQATLARCRNQAAGLPRDPQEGRGNQTQQAGRALEGAAAQIRYIDNCLLAEGWQRE